MKKLMIAAAAAALVGGAFALESANIVGYQNIEVLDEGFTFITPTFTQVGGRQTKLSDIAGDFNFFDSIQLLDDEGGTASEFFWLGEGWFDENNDPADNVVIDEGTGILFSSQGTTAVTFKGEVKTSASQKECLSEGFTAAGNCTPVDVELGDITFEDIAFFDSIQLLDADGATECEYFWLGEGWFDENNDPADDVVIHAGQGFLFSAGSGSGDTVVVSVPSAVN